MVLNDEPDDLYTKKQCSLISALRQLSGLTEFECLCALREHKWDLTDSLMYVNTHRDELSNSLRYNRYG